MIQIQLPQTRRKARIEIVPLIDIIFFLLATFVLVSMSMVKNHGVPIRLPVAASSKSLGNTQALIIRISLDGALTVDRQPLSIEALAPRLNEFKQTAGEDARVIIQGDSGVEYGRVISVLDSVRQSGIAKVAVQTTKKGS